MSTSVTFHPSTPLAFGGNGPRPYIDVLGPGAHGSGRVGAETSVGTDAVTLSLSAKIHLLKNQGHSDQQIALALNVDTVTVGSYLGAPTIPAVTASASAPLPVAK